MKTTHHVLRRAGRRTNGHERDGGILWHAVPRGTYKALCGAEPGRKSAWGEYPGLAVTCPKCLKKLANQDAMTHTHIGWRSHVGYAHCGSRLWGHHLPSPGKTHALNGGPTTFTALCGEVVTLDHPYDEWGEPRLPNVREGGKVTCKRCLRQMGSQP
jgi:hypothetical protein